MSMCLPRLHSNQQAALAWRNTAWAVRVGNASEQRMGDIEMVSVKDPAESLAVRIGEWYTQICISSPSAVLVVKGE